MLVHLSAPVALDGDVGHPLVLELLTILLLLLLLCGIGPPEARARR